MMFASVSPTTAPRQCPTCIGPVGLAETYSTFTLRAPPMAERPNSLPCDSTRRTTCRQKRSESRKLTKPGPATSTAATSSSLPSSAAISSARLRGFLPSGLARTIATLEARSPWLGSRGGSTETLERSGRAPEASLRSSASTVFLIRSLKSAKIFMSAFREMRALAAKTARALAQFRRTVKQPAVFLQRVCIGHAGKEIGDAARPEALFGAIEPVAPALRHGARIGHVGVEQLAHDAICSGAFRHYRGVAVEVLVEKRLESLLVGGHAFRKCNHRLAGVVDVLDALRRERGEPLPGRDDHILDHHGDLAAHQLVAGPGGVEMRITGANARKNARRRWHVLEHVECEQAGAQAVVDVVGVIGDVVGDRGALRLDARMAPQFEVEQLVEVADGARHRPFEPVTFP